MPNSRAAKRRRRRKKKSSEDTFADIFNDLDRPLKILIWGPGERAQKDWFEKRTILIDHLKTVRCSKDEVFTSEEMLRKIPAPDGIEPGTAELRHAQWADVILVLVFGPPNVQGGAYRELQLLAPKPELRRKVWIFMPDQKDWHESFSGAMLQIYRSHQKITLSWEDLKKCQQLRQISQDKVEEQRRELMYDKLMAATTFSN